MASNSAAEFFDGDKRSRGSAARVTRRQRALSGLTSLDVAGADGVLATFLTHLDKGPLVVRFATGGDAGFVFRWASGYANGDEIRVQGLLEA
jgi:hypothetical protein